MNPDDYFTHPQFKGVVVAYVGPEMEKILPDPHEHECDPDGCWCCWWGTDAEDWETVPTGRVYVRMVGDDVHYPVDPSDLVPHEDPVCSCGQTGCGWHG